MQGLDKVRKNEKVIRSKINNIKEELKQKIRDEGKIKKKLIKKRKNLKSIKKRLINKKKRMLKNLLNCNHGLSGFGGLSGKTILFGVGLLILLLHLFL